ncbi:serine/threonine-protein kinase Nek2-like [Hydractinia symbiolongicarpus]|uniref:serine/threonine-protein kinase Nek2-like n=1 Tax=Hydractinia symbiolongicarpus TaxID=13093 RepID=UPI0025500903|nr:serine/threonine-protein kinase Nek2-like [Hydractinia symbiolongicarpus]
MPSNKLEDYQVLSTIGTGAYGTCRKIQRKSDGKIRVWKELDYGTMSDAEKQLLVSEVNLLRELKHENIVRYHDRIIDKVSTKIYIIMEYCEGGDLAALVLKHKKERKYIDEPFIWKVLYQLSSALKECHNCSRAGNTVLHRDLKPANVFLDGNKNCKLGDFGLARVLHHETSFAKTFVGTPYYMSPELVNRSSYNEKSDIWSLGCLIYELCALLPPFLAANQKMLALKIQDGHFKPIPSHYSKDMQRIIERMLTVVESRRPSIQDILNSQLVQKNMKMGRDMKIAASSETSSVVLQRREESLNLRERRLDEREKELERRERLLEERERLSNEKVTRPEPRYYTGHKRTTLDQFQDKENMFFHKEISKNALYGEDRHERALRFLDQNHALPRYESRLRGAYGGLR